MLYVFSLERLHSRLTRSSYNKNQTMGMRGVGIGFPNEKLWWQLRQVRDVSDRIQPTFFKS
ncbi:MAG: hypothetical protein SAL70_10690 [Scytonema sp. PMC 1070.18]|nr:hypothetical protein [Scytonema sp. PMC 1070.18]